MKEREECQGSVIEIWLWGEDLQLNYFCCNLLYILFCSKFYANASGRECKSKIALRFLPIS